MKPAAERRRSWIIAGVLMVALAGLVGAWLYSVSTDTIRVVTNSRELAPGDVLTANDIRVVEIGRTTDFRVVTADQQSLVVGKPARAMIPTGTVLNPGLFVDPEAVVPAGSVVVGVKLDPGAIPVGSLESGDKVAVYSVTSDAVRESTSTRVGEATVWTVESLDESTGSMLVSLLVDDSLAEKVAAAAGSGAVRLGLLS